MDVIIEKYGLVHWEGASPEDIKEAFKEVIHQVLVMASEKARVIPDPKVSPYQGLRDADTCMVDKQSILDVEKLVV